ncbi:MAG: sulfite exporter TauE/SafE family protein [Desulfobacteraceae bacterium]
MKTVRPTLFSRIKSTSLPLSRNSLLFWLILDGVYIAALFIWLPATIPPARNFFIFHLAGMAIGSMVMYAGLGAGVLWIPILSFLKITPMEAISLSVFTQIAGKGVGSYNYIRAKMVDLKVARHFLPYAFWGVFIGYFSGYAISVKYERLLLVIFILVACGLLFRMVQSLYLEDDKAGAGVDYKAMENSGFIVTASSFFTGMLSIGNCDWLIPHMELSLKMTTSRSVATGLFIMFFSSLFFLLLTAVSVTFGIRSWPASSPILFATCSGVIIGGQIGTRVIKYRWFRERQKHAFIVMLACSIIHLLW